MQIFFAASEIADDSVGILRTSEYSAVDSEHCGGSASANTLCYGEIGDRDLEEDCKVPSPQIRGRTREVFYQTDALASGCPGRRQSRGVQLRRRGAARADGHADDGRRLREEQKAQAGYESAEPLGLDRGGVREVMVT